MHTTVCSTYLLHIFWHVAIFLFEILCFVRFLTQKMIRWNRIRPYINDSSKKMSPWYVKNCVIWISYLFVSHYVETSRHVGPVLAKAEALLLLPDLKKWRPKSTSSLFSRTIQNVLFKKWNIFNKTNLLLTFY